MSALLAINWNVDPVIFHIGKLAIKYYSLLFVSGFILGYYLFMWFYKREGLPAKLLDPLLYAMLLCTLVGARLGHVLFYDPAYYFAHPIEIIQTWKGGLASHGGAIGVILGIWWYVNRYGKKYGFDFFWIIDRLAIAVGFEGCLIRLGNLFNSEIYGDPTDLPWGFVFKLRGETIPKHPTQIYEALAYLALGIVLLWVYRKYLPRLKRGVIFSVFIIGCFTARFFIEFIKQVQEPFEKGMSLNMGQILSIPFILTGIIILIWVHKHGRSSMLTPTKLNTAREAAKNLL